MSLRAIHNEQKYKEITDVLKEHVGELDYKILNEILSNKFEGVRLALKTMKDKEMVTFDGFVPPFESLTKLEE